MGDSFARVTSTQVLSLTLIDSQLSSVRGRLRITALHGFIAYIILAEYLCVLLKMPEHANKRGAVRKTRSSEGAVP